MKRKKAKSSKQPLTVAPGGAETKRVLVHWPMIVALVLAMGSALAAYQVVNFLGQGDLFGLRALEVGGLRLLDGDDVLAASGLEVGTNIFAVDLEEVEQRLENVCWIERAMVMRKPPDRLAVEIVERQRLAWVELGATYGIARDGVHRKRALGRGTRHAQPDDGLQRIRNAPPLLVVHAFAGPAGAGGHVLRYADAARGLDVAEQRLHGGQRADQVLGLLGLAVERRAVAIAELAEGVHGMTIGRVAAQGRASEKPLGFDPRIALCAECVKASTVDGRWTIRSVTAPSL